MVSFGAKTMSTIEVRQNAGGNASAYYKYRDGEIGFIRQISISDLELWEEFEILPDLTHFIPEPLEA